MRIIETKAYTFDELSEDAKERAMDEYRNKGYIDDIWGDERHESYNKAIEIYNQLKNIEEEISGGRLVAWIENNLSYIWRTSNRIGKHSNAHGGVVTKRRTRNGYWFCNSHWEYKYDCVAFRLSMVFASNNIDNCPLTGVCYDYDFLEPIINFMKKPSNSITNLDLCEDMPSLESIAERDREYENSDEFISEYFIANDCEFTEEGEMI